MLNMQSREDIYHDRIDRFRRVIQKWQNEEEKKIKQKSKDQQEFERFKILNQAKEHDDEEFTRRQKGIDVDAKIKKSRKINEMRLSKMKLRFQFIEKVQNQIKHKLKSVCDDEGMYSKLLEDLLIQGMTKMLEQKIEVRCVSKDVDLVKRAISKAQTLFSQICDIKTQLVMGDQRLPDSELGGVVLSSYRGKIVCNNTLRARLDYALQLSLPEVREMLFTNKKLND